MKILCKGRYRIGIATTDAEIRAAQRLRWLCFCSTQMGAAQMDDALDIDDYDQACLHVLIHEIASGQLVACFRMMMLSGGAEIGRSYSAQYYDLEGLRGFPGPMIEVGRFCVHPAHSSPEILRAAWAAGFTALSFLTTTGWRATGWEAARGAAGIESAGLLLAGLAIFGGGIATTAETTPAFSICLRISPSPPVFEAMVPLAITTAASPWAESLERMCCIQA